MDFQVFTSSGTFVVPAGVTSIFVECTGGGGGGNGNAGSAGSFSGGSGGYCVATQTVTNGQSIPVTIGAGGSGGASGANNGGDGGNTTFNGLTANGGTKATTAANGSAGSSSGGDTNTSAYFIKSTIGSGIPWHTEMYGNATAMNASDTNKIPVFQPGSGAPTVNVSLTASTAGQPGANGMVIVWYN